jgi:magnesium-transporting ATPase (P-type)
MNKMTLIHLFIANYNEFDCLKNSETISDYYKALINFASLCNRAKMEEQNIFKGSATECGILKFTASTLASIENLREKNQIVNEIPFNSRNKYHLTIHKLNKEEFSPIPISCTSLLDKSKDKDFLCVIKGAPEVIFDLCSCGLNRDKIESFETTKDLCFDQSIKYCENGERVLGLAFSFISYDEQLLIEENNLPIDFCFVGLISLIDPPRPGVADAVNQCHEGSIKVMMVTGDHHMTAISIAKMVNIVSSKSKIKYFAEIDDELKKIIPDKKPQKSCLKKKFKCFEVLTSKIFPKERKSIVTKYKVDGAVVICGKDFQLFNDQHWDYIFSHNEIIFARTTPQNKLLIVNELRRNGEIVTVTGDGVNGNILN